MKLRSDSLKDKHDKSLIRHIKKMKGPKQIKSDIKKEKLHLTPKKYN